MLDLRYTSHPDVTRMDSGGQLFCLLMLQTVAWVTCPPYLSMDDRGLSLAPSSRASISIPYLNSGQTMELFSGFGVMGCSLRLVDGLHYSIKIILLSL